jgi:hypothetical protein
VQLIDLSSQDPLNPPLDTTAACRRYCRTGRPHFGGKLPDGAISYIQTSCMTNILFHCPTDSIRSPRSLILLSTTIPSIPKASYYRIISVSKRPIEDSTTLINPRCLTTSSRNLQPSKIIKSNMSSPKEFPPQKVRSVVAEVMMLLGERGENVCVAETVSLHFGF